MTKWRSPSPIDCRADEVPAQAQALLAGLVASDDVDEGVLDGRRGEQAGLEPGMQAFGRSVGQGERRLVGEALDDDQEALVGRSRGSRPS